MGVPWGRAVLGVPWGRVLPLHLPGPTPAQSTRDTEDMESTRHSLLLLGGILAVQGWRGVGRAVPRAGCPPVLTLTPIPSWEFHPSVLWDVGAAWGSLMCVDMSDPSLGAPAGVTEPEQLQLPSCTCAMS